MDSRLTPPPLSFALPAALPGGIRPAAPGVSGPLPLSPTAGSPELGVRAALDFTGWDLAVTSATVRGDMPYPGNASDAGSVAEAITGLLFDRR